MTTMNDPVIEYQESWRGRDWDESVPSRPAWFVSCSDHPRLGRDSSGNRWGYAHLRTARQVLTRHRRTKHAG